MSYGLSMKGKPMSESVDYSIENKKLLRELMYDARKMSIIIKNEKKLTVANAS